MEKMTEQQIDELAKNILMMMNGVTTVADLKGVSQKQLEAAYGLGYTYYNSGRYDEAEKIFKFLCVFEHTSHKYWTALGAVRQAKKDYKKAIEAYASAALFDCEDPKPHYYSAECSMLLGDLDTADNALYSLLKLCPAGVPRNDDYRARAEKLQGVIKSLREKAEAKGGK